MPDHDYKNLPTPNSVFKGKQTRIASRFLKQLVTLTVLVAISAAFSRSSSFSSTSSSSSNISSLSNLTTSSQSLDISTAGNYLLQSRPQKRASGTPESYQVQIGQYNMGKKPKAAIELNAALRDSDSSFKPQVILIQEPPQKLKSPERGTILAASPVTTVNKKGEIIIKHPRAAIYLENDFLAKSGAILLDNLTSLDQTAVSLKVEISKGVFINLILCSLYIPPDAKTSEIPPHNLIELLNHCRDTNAELILGSDCNSHHSRWGSKTTDAKGKKIVELMESFDLELLNVGDKSTYIRNKTRKGSPESIVDISLCSSKIYDNVGEWEVSDELIVSDHKLIIFMLDSTKPPAMLNRPSRFTDWKLFNKLLENSTVLKHIEKLDYKMNSIGLNEASDLLLSEIICAFHKSCKLRKKRLPCKQAWYTSSFYILRAKLRRILRRYHKTGKETYATKFRALRSKYSKKCTKARLKHWKGVLHKLDSTKDLARMQKFMENGSSKLLTTILKSDGSYTKSQSETQAELMRSHFKGAKELGPNDDWPDELPEDLTLTDKEIRDIETCVTKAKIKWAIKSFQPFKSAGTDEVFPALLQKSIDHIIGSLVILFRASLVTGYIPMSWRGSKVTFIPKPGKDSYGKASSYRPISLMSFILKTCEKLMDKHIRYEELKKNPIDQNQHAYKAGRSTDSAIHSLLHELEKSIQNKKYSLFMFVDVAGAFDVTSVECVAEAAKKKGVSPWCIRWIVSMLRNRQTETSNEHCLNRFVPQRGVAQGGVTSPLSFSLVADSLIKILKDLGLSVVGYADDLAIGFSHTNLDRTISQINKATRAIEKWCDETGLDVNPDKTQLVCFTNKKLFFKTPNPKGKPNPKAKRIVNKNHLLQNDNPYGSRTCHIRNIKLRGKELLLSDSVKYLGVHLDSKLNMNVHIKEAAKRAKNAYWALSKLCKNKWGIKPSKAIYIIRSIVIPRITYGSIAFWHKLDPSIDRNLTRINTINSVFNSIIKKAVGSLRSTPTIPLMSILNLTPINLEIKRRAAECYLRLADSGAWKSRNSSYGHAAIQKFTENITNFNSGSESTSLKWRVEDLYGVSAVIRVSPPSNGVNLFVDGATNKNGSGVGIFCPELNISRKYKLANATSSHQTERLAIHKAAETLNNLKDIPNNLIFIWSDSLTAVKSFLSPATSNKAEWECSELLNSFVSTEGVRRVTIGWLSKKAKHPNSIMADKLAKEAANGNADAIIQNPLPPHTISTLFDLWILKEKRKQWESFVKTSDTQGKFLVSRLFLNGYDDDRLSRIKNLSRIKLRTIIQVLTGAAPLAGLVNKFKPEVSPLCSLCGRETETIPHLFLHCQSIKASNSRVKAFQDTQLNSASLKTLKVDEILKFCKHIELDKLTEKFASDISQNSHESDEE